MMKRHDLISRMLIVKGLVQGVGFRPFIFRLAVKHGITGWVENRNDAVYIVAGGPADKLERFIEGISRDKPEASQIHDIEISESHDILPDDFEIRWSRDEGDSVTEISPDIAVCNDCLEDMQSQPHRINYPFTNCTRCGPRFSIITGLPYDRVNTTMSGFVMCPDCEKEYHDIGDRRFHAQPVACNHCGPAYQLISKDTGALSDIPEILLAIK